MRGELKNLQQAEFYLYTIDDVLSRIDTVRVMNGRFEHVYPLNAPATLHLVYPHMAEQIIFANSGDIIDMEGDAANLRDIIVSGNNDNEQYTKLRLALNECDEAGRDSLIDNFVASNPTSRVSIYLLQRKGAESFRNPPIRKGAKLPQFTLTAHSTDSLGNKQGGRRLFNADSLTHKDLQGHPAIIAFWAYWRSNSSQCLYSIRQQLAKHSDMVSLSVCADMAYSNHMRIARRDSILSDKYAKRWWTYCDTHGPTSGLFAEWSITEVPYFIYVDTKGTVRACGTDFDKHIKPNL